MGGRSLHVLESGRGGPVVVLEAGIAASSISWSRVQEEVARFTTVLSYDRAGFGWSSCAAGHDGTARAAARDLKALLDHSGHAGPYVLAGHSFGGLIARIFQQEYPDRVAGLVLVDPVTRSEWNCATEARLRMLARGVMLSRRGAVLARLGVVGMALRLLTGGSRRIPQLLARLSAGKGASVTDRLAGEVRKLPKEHWPVIAEHWSRHEPFEAMARNLEKLPESVNQLDAARRLGDLPLTILTARHANPEHEADARLSTRGEVMVIPESGHWIQLDAAGAVVAAIEKMVRSL